MNREQYTYRATALAAAVALVAIAAAFAVAVIFHGTDSDSTPIVSAVLGLIGAAVPGLLAVFVSERTRNVVENGLPSKIAQEAAPVIAEHVNETIERSAIARGAAIAAGTAPDRRQP